jgi:pimeloyl-ACP methyl ester carboxylesterase
MTDAKPLLPGLEPRELTHRGARLRYFVGGAGPPIVLVHGLGGAASNWREVAPELGRDRRVLVPELPGHGGSAPLAAVPGLAPYAESVLAVARHEGMTPAPVVGHSLGGLVALRAALLSPSAVSGVVLAGSAGIASTSRRARLALTVVGLVQPGRRLAPHHRRLAHSRSLRYAAFWRWGASDPAALAPRAAEGFLAGPLLHTDTVSAARALVADDPRTELHALACPALVLWGSRDTQLPIDDAFDYARRLRAPLRLVPDCGHLLIGERPDACLDAIRDFLGRLSP